MLTLPLCACATAEPLTSWRPPSWEEWKRQHGRHHYSSQAEEARRHSVFSANVAAIAAHNAQAAAGLHSYTMGVNAFSDLTAREFAAQYHPQRPQWWAAESVQQQQQQQQQQQLAEVVVLPPPPAAATVDWRTKGAVSCTCQNNIYTVSTTN